MRTIDKIQQTARSTGEEYAHGADRPLRGYLTVLGAYGVVLGGLVTAGRVLGVRLPDRFTARDTALIGIATHKASRLLAKDAVAGPLRAPFTRYEEPAGDGELNESVRGHGTRHAIGELLTCPFCLSVWVATGLTAGTVFAPRVTRAVGTVLTAVAVSDTLQLGYDAAKQVLRRLSR